MQRMTRWTTALLWGLAALILSPTTSSGQTTPADRVVADSATTACEAPRRCRSAAEINQAADALCARARAKEPRYDDVVTEAGKQRLRANQCEGRLDATGDIAAMVPRLQGEIAGLEAEQSTRWVWELLGVTTGATAASLVWCGAGGGCPEAVAWSLVGATVVQVGVWVFRLVTR